MSWILNDGRDRLQQLQLPYGTDADWRRNVPAAGGCVLEHDGVRYAAPALP